MFRRIALPLSLSSRKIHATHRPMSHSSELKPVLKRGFRQYLNRVYGDLVHISLVAENPHIRIPPRAITMTSVIIATTFYITGMVITIAGSIVFMGVLLVTADYMFVD